MAPVGTVQFLLSGTCKKHICPELPPMNMSPDWHPQHPCYSQPKAGSTQKCRLLSSHLPEVHGIGYLVLSVTAGMWAGEEFLRGREGTGRALPSALTGARHQGSTCCGN